MARFWSKVNKTDTCWLWMGYLDKSGYGRFSIGKYSKRKPHRVAYEFEFGPIPGGIQIDHICHVPSCVRPAHLRPTTAKENQENRTAARTDSASGIRGVNFDQRRGKWDARIRHNGKRIWCGTFDSAGEAEAAVVAKRLELFTHNDHDRAA